MLYTTFNWQTMPVKKLHFPFGNIKEVYKQSLFAIFQVIKACYLYLNTGINYC